MKPIDHALQVLIGREPTTEELKKFYTIKETLDIPDYDAAWTMLLAFGHYEILYRDIPEQIAAQANKLMADHRLLLTSTADAAERQVRASVSDSLADTMRKATQEALDATNVLIKKDCRKRFLIGASLSVGIAVIGIGLLCWASAHLATSAALAMRAQVATAAARFIELNDVSKMMACQGADMQTRRVGDNLYCVPFDERAKRVGGWRIK